MITEQIKTLNQRLKDNFGRFENGEAIWRIVFSDDQLEKQHGTFREYDQSGNFIREYQGVKEVKKYEWIRGKYLLERYTPVPFQNKYELVEAKVSYEPVWVFEDKNGSPLPPIWDVIEIVIQDIHRKAMQAVGIRVPYKDPEAVQDPEAKLLRTDKLVEELFGNETPVGDALSHKYGVTVPNNYEKDK